MTEIKIADPSIRYVARVAAIVKQLKPGDRVRAEFGPDLIIEGPVKEGPYNTVRIGNSHCLWVGGRVHIDLTALTVLSLAPRPDLEPWWAGAEAVVDKYGLPWIAGTRRFERTGRIRRTAVELETDYGPCTPIRQDGRTILSKEEIEAASYRLAESAVWKAEVVREVLTELHGWREGEK